MHAVFWLDSPDTACVLFELLATAGLPGLLYILFGKPVLMSRGPSTYTSSFKHIGPLQVIIDKSESTVVSVLGIRTFKFTRLPSNRDNRYATLRYALKAYFSSLIENFDTAGQQEQPASLFGFLKSMMAPLAISSGDSMDTLKGRICKDYRLFDWEDIRGFYEIQNGDNVLSSLAKPALVELAGDLQMSQALMEEDEIIVVDSTVCEDEKSMFLEKFIAGEVCFFDKIQEYKNEFSIYMEFNEDMKRRDLVNFFKVVDSHHTLILSLASQFCGYFNRTGLQLAKQIIFKYKLAQEEKDGDPCNYGSVAAFYIDNFHHLDSYLDFATDYDDVLRSAACSIKETVREAFTSVLLKVTNYSKVFRQMCEYDPSPDLRRLYKLSSALSRELNSEAERSHHRNLKIGLLKVRGNGFVRDQSLESMLECSVAGKKHGLYLFSRSICVFDSGLSLKGTSDVFSSNLIIYNKKLFWLSDSLESSMSRPVPSSTCKYLAADVQNKEAAKEFYSAFYRTKYQGESRGNVCFRTCGPSEKCRMIRPQTLGGGQERGSGKVSMEECGKGTSHQHVCKPEVLVTCLGVLDSGDSGSKLYEVKIEDTNFRTGGILKLAREELHGQIEEFVLAKRRIEILGMQDLGIVRILLESVDPAKIVPFLLNSYQEDDLSFDRKKAVFDELCKGISDFSGGPIGRTTAHIGTPLDLGSFLYENDVLKSLTSVEIDYFSRLYLLLTSPVGCITTVLSGRSLEDLVILCSMFVQRNVYALIHPDDLDKLATYIERGDCDKQYGSMRPHSRMHLSRVLEACQSLVARGHPGFSRTILGVLFNGDVDPRSLHERINKAC